MFEKEAEEYCMHQSLLEDVRDNICKAFEDGAEFGYNKANEWYYPSKGEYPKENAELKSKNCWKTCEYAEPKSQLISQYIQDVAQLSKAKEIIKKLVHEFYYLCELYNFATDYECLAEAEQFLNSEVEE